MGYVKKRIANDGSKRYTACFLDLRGSLRSAGTFPNRKDASKAWQRAEAKIAEGRVNDPRRGRQRFERYVTEEWLPHHVMEATTREAHTYQLRKHILPLVRPNAHERDHAQSGARVGERPAGQRSETGNH
jgi:hypothetical protein